MSDDPKHGDAFDTPLGRVVCDARVPEDEIHMETASGLVKFINVGKPQALEPSAIEKMPRGYSLGIDKALGESYSASWPDPEYVSPLQRALGYTRNPMSCGHYKKRLYLGTTTWHCIECGERFAERGEKEDDADD